MFWNTNDWNLNVSLPKIMFKRGDSRSMALSGRLETKNIIDNYMARKPIQAKVRSPKVRREIPLVELEYLNLTAAAIYMKYNKKGDPYNQLNLTSQELIQASQNLPFYNIYDFMCDYVESRRRRFEEQALSLEMSANPVVTFVNLVLQWCVG